MAADYDTFGDVFKSADVVIAKVNADEHKELASRFGVKGFPTLKWFPAGKISIQHELLLHTASMSERGPAFDVLDSCRF